MIETPVQTVLGTLSDIEEKNAPETLYLRGNAKLLRGGLRVCVIGTRKPTDAGRENARTYSEFLASRGVIVVSGLAMGIDTVAHKTAIESGGSTIAVLGTPLDQVSPTQNRELQETIGRDHLLVSQFASGSRVYPGNFPARNRTMALLSDATIIIEASESSGTAHQGWEALRLGRPLFMLEPVVSAGHDWANKMLDYGAYVLAAPDELYEALPIRMRAANDGPAF